MKISINLPNLVRVRDYHELNRVKDLLNQLDIKNIHVKEIGFDGDYIGIVYLGTFRNALKQSPEARQIIAKEKEENDCYYS